MMMDIAANEYLEYGKFGALVSIGKLFGWKWKISHLSTKNDIFASVAQALTKKLCTARN